MRAALQLRASAVGRCALACAICSLSIATFGQAPTSPDAMPTRNVEATVGAPTKHQAQAAEDAYLAGARLLDHNDLTGAEIQFDKAVKLNASNNDYAMAYAVTHQRHITELVQASGKARLLGQNEKADTLLAEARLLDPQNNIVGHSVAPTRRRWPRCRNRKAPAGLRPAHRSGGENSLGLEWEGG